MKIKPQGWPILLALIILGSLVQLAFNTRITTDISSFIPSGKSEKQKILFEELKQGVSGKLWLLAIEGNNPDTLALQNQQLASQLLDTKLFSAISNGAVVERDDSLKLLMKYRYLLHEPKDDFSKSRLRIALNERLNDLRSPFSTFNKELIASDPLAYSNDIFSRISADKELSPKYKGVWFSNKRNKTFLVAESLAEGLDLDAQNEVRTKIVESFAKINSRNETVLRITGSPQIGLMTRDSIQADSKMLSIIASIFLMVVLVTVYRHPGILIFAAIPLVFGVVISAAATSIIFGSIHGITLAFGITLLGIALDYPVHILSHRKQSDGLRTTINHIWPTMRLGAITTSLGYAAMIFAKFDGVVQLGVFSVIGVSAAIVISRFILPELGFLAKSNLDNSGFISKRFLSYQVPGSQYIALIVLIASAAVFGLTKPILSEDISELSPVPASLKAEIQTFRQDIGIAEPRYIIYVKGKTAEAVLQAEEKMVPQLEKMKANKYVQSIDYAARVLPSSNSQLQRQKQLPDSGRLRKNLTEAMVGTPFKAGTFKTFLVDVEKSRSLTPLTPEVFTSVLIGQSLSGLLRQREDSALGIIRLAGVTHPDKIASVISGLADQNIWFVDIRKSTSENIREFSFGVLKSIGWALGIILLVLLINIRGLKKVAKIAVPVALSIAVAAAIPLLLGQRLNLFHLVSLLLVAGIGIDYALFFSRKFDQQQDLIMTFQSLSVCSISTIGVFATISFSKVPVLNSIGVTVASGVCAAFIFAWIFSRSRVE